MSISFNGFLKAFRVSVVIASTTLAVQTPAQTTTQTPTKTSPKISVTPKVRITEKIDNSNTVAIAHSHAPLVDHLKDMGRVPANTVFHHMHLVLKSSDEQEFALQGFLDQQQDHTHPNYHQWLTPETFASSFGVHPADIAQITAWLQNSGFTVEKVARGSRIIDFSGTSGAVESAFHTEMHQYTVNGETRISNSTDISIPHALASVVVGPGALNNFRAKHDIHSYKVTLDPTGKVISQTPKNNDPLLSTTNDLPYDQGEFVGAADMATIYNTNPLLAQGYNGKGVSIGIVAESDILMSDVQVYRAIFGLPINQPTFLNVGKDPGIPYTGDDGESDLDVEVSGAMAPGASIVFVIGSQDGVQFGGVGAGVDSAAEYLVDNNLTDIISSSYGLDELDLGADGIAFYGSLWEEAAAQGQSVFEASGDNGPDEFDDGASYGDYYSVDGDSTTPWDVAVGGTEFNEGSSFNTASTANTGTPYWGPYSTGIPYESAKSYIPEQPWNDTRYGLQAQNGDYVIGDMVAETSGVSYWWQIPSWQTGFGVPTSDPTPPAGTYPSFSAPYGQSSITALRLTNDGSGYTSAPTVTIAPPTCAPLGTATCATATGTANPPATTGRNAGKITALNLTSPGAGYTAVPAVTLTGGGGTGATATATLSPSSFQVPGPHRLVPDVAMNASVQHDATIYCTEGDCDQYPNGSLESFDAVGGTSVAAPSMAGVQAIINQVNGGRQGNPNYYYYRLANMQSQTACVANANYVTTSGCSFHDSQAGNNFVPATSGTTNYIGWATGPGFDMAIGLGSPDVTNLATNWKTANFNATTTALNLTTASGSATITGNPMDTYNVLVSVYPVAGTAGANGAPTGDVSIIAATNVGGSIAFFTLSGNAPGGGSSTGGTITALPAGTYNIYAHYGGDTVYGGSNSAPIQVTINQSPVTLALQVNDLTGLGQIITTNTMGYSQDTVIFTGILPPSNTSGALGYPVPTGTVTYTISNGAATVSTATVPVDPNGYQIGNIYYNAAAEYDAGEGFELYVTQPNAPPLPAGNYTVVAAYSGDRTFLPTTATANFTITPVLPSYESGTTLVYTYLVGFNSLSTEVPLTGTATFNVEMENPLGTAGCLPATGLVTFTDITANKVLGTASLTNTSPNLNSYATFTTSPGAFQTTGTHTIAMNYLGDNNFLPFTTNGTSYFNLNVGTLSNVNITVGGTSPTSISLAATPTTGTANYLQRVTLTATLPTTVTAGTVYFFDNSTGSPTGTPVELGSGRISASTHTATYSTYALLAGNHSFSAQYGGSGTVGTITSATVPYVLNKNVPILSLGGGINGDVGTGYAFEGNWTPNTTGTQYQAAPLYLDGDELTVPPTAAFELLDTTNGNAVVASAIPQYQYAIYSPYYVATGIATATGGSGLTPLTPGYHQLAGYYVGDANYASATSATYAVAVGITSLTLGSSATNIGTGEPITFTATVVPNYPTTTTATGTVKFYDNGTLLGTYPATTPATTVIPVKPVGTVPVSYVATLTTTLTTPGSHTITAVYSGDSHFYTSSGTLGSNVTAVTPGFTLYIDPASPTSLTLTRGTSGSFNIDALVVGNWAGTAPLVCEGLPANSYCTFTFPSNYNPPAYFTFSGADGVFGPVQVTITTLKPHETGAKGSELLWFPAVLLAGLLGLRRKQLTMRQRQLLLLAVLLCGSLATTACSSLGMATPGGSYTVQVQANGVGSTSASPNIQPLLNVPLTLTVQ